MTEPALIPDPAACDDAACGRRARRRAERREAIIDVAHGMFMEHGYAATTMSAIAARLGGSKATLWNYFASKDLLFAAVIDRGAAQFCEDVASALTPRGDVREMLLRFTVRYLGNIIMPERVSIFRMIVAEAGRFPEVGRIFHERGVGRMRQILAGAIAEAMADGWLAPGDPLRAAYQLLAMCMSRSHHQLLFGLIDEVHPETIAAECEAAVALFMRAYAPAAPSP